MAEPFLAELRLMSFNFAPKGWAECNGQVLPINQNQALFSLLGTNYGGDGRVNFALPDLRRGRAQMHAGNSFVLGERFGEESHMLTISEMPSHTHPVSASSQNGDKADIGILAQISQAYDATPNTTLHPATVTNAGGSQAHNNLQPYIVLEWCIALEGIFPSQT